MCQNCRREALKKSGHSLDDVRAPAEPKEPQLVVLTLELSTASICWKPVDLSKRKLPYACLTGICPWTSLLLQYLCAERVGVDPHPSTDQVVTSVRMDVQHRNASISSHHNNTSRAEDLELTSYPVQDTLAVQAQSYHWNDRIVLNSQDLGPMTNAYKFICVPTPWHLAAIKSHLLRPSDNVLRH